MATMINFHIVKNTRKLDRIMSNMESRIDATTKEVAEAVVEHIQENWSEEVPSSPGQPPARRSWFLSSNINISQQRSAKGRFASGYIIEFGAEYAAALEFGYEPNNLEPRPFIDPAMIAVSQRVDKYFRSMFEFF